MDVERAQHILRQLLPYAAIPVGLYALTRILTRLVPGPQHHSKLVYKDKTALIIGASTGLGRALAFELHKRGAKVILTARSIDKLKELAEELKQSHENPHEPEYRYLDVADPTDVEDLAKLSIDGKTIDILINNAGTSNRGAIEDTPIGIYKQVMEVNFFGIVSVTKALLPSIPDTGCIIVTSSLQGRISIPYRSCYAASKHALQAFFDSLRAETRPKLHILVVSAGYINTGFGSRALDVHGQPVGIEDENQKKGMSPEDAALQILHAASSRQTDLLLAPLFHRLGVFIRWAWPNLYFYSVYKRGLTDQFAKKH